jgi:hypothetical protein
MSDRRLDPVNCLCEYCSYRICCKGCLKNCSVCGVKVKGPRCSEDYVRVLRADGSFGNAKIVMLDGLIERGEIAGFYRLSGWVMVEKKDVIRREKKLHSGYDRRRPPKESTD